MIPLPTWTIPSTFLYLCILWLLFTTHLHSYWNLASQVLPSALHRSRNIQRVNFQSTREWQLNTFHDISFWWILILSLRDRSSRYCWFGGFFATHRCITRSGSVERQKGNKIFAWWKWCFGKQPSTPPERWKQRIKKKTLFARPCTQNYAPFPHTTLAQSPDSFLGILLWYQPRLRSKAPWGHSTVLRWATAWKPGAKSTELSEHQESEQERGFTLKWSI